MAGSSPAMTNDCCSGISGARHRPCCLRRGVRLSRFSLFAHFFLRISGKPDMRARKGDGAPDGAPVLSVSRMSLRTCGRLPALRRGVRSAPGRALLHASPELRKTPVSRLPAGDPSVSGRSPGAARERGCWPRARAPHAGIAVANAGLFRALHASRSNRFASLHGIGRIG
jgi:hypothetical protein